MKALVIDQLDFSYEQTPVLKAVNLSVEKGEFIGIFGPNGGGKTTLIHLILGLLTPTKGRIELFGLSPKEARFKIGYVPQMLRCDKDFPITVLEVVMMGALQELSWLGRYPLKSYKKGLSALEKVGLLHKQKALFGSLSGGEAQRVLIARAIMNGPEMLILDEPTAHLDLLATQEIQALLTTLSQETTILMVTHDLETIIDKVGRLFCVQKSVTSLKAKEVCEHFALGLYHTPLTPNAYAHFSLK